MIQELRISTIGEPVVPTFMWGMDHWAVFAYIETCCVESQTDRGYPDHRRIQTNQGRHPGMDNPVDGSQYGIRLRGGVEIVGPDYDEWDVIDDLAAVGLIEILGSGINPAYRMTEGGLEMAGQLRRHKAMGGQLANFTPRWGGHSDDDR